MRALDPSGMAPWGLEEPSHEMVEAARATTRTAWSRGQPRSRVNAGKVLLKFVREDADRRWLEANLPAGTAFEHLGVPCM